MTLRDHVISPIIAGVRVPRRGRPPATSTLIDRDYENLRVDMYKLFHDLALTTAAAGRMCAKAARQRKLRDVDACATG